MSFTSGRVSFTRFAVIGDAPATVDDTLLATLAQHSYRQTEVGAPPEIEAGFTTGDHLYDTQFSYEKNGYGVAGILALFALRIDTNKVPSEVKHAYKRMNESALAQQNPSGFATKSQKKEAAETAENQVREDLKSGKFRKSKTVQILWDLQRSELYVGGSGNTLVEQLARIMRDAFNVKLEQLTPGALAGRYLRKQGKSRDYEDLRPSPFTRPPDAPADAQAGAIPLVPWTQSSVDLKDFLGNEFLTWLWWSNETKADFCPYVAVIDGEIRLECAWGVTGRDQVHAEKPSRAPEAHEALALGKWPRQAGLILAETMDNLQWDLTLQADKWTVSGVTLPEATHAESLREVIEHRLECTRGLARALDALFHDFIQLRADSAAWPANREQIAEWIKQPA